ncbi:hypothetical protein HDU97_009114 [Phlyctochytrium planicorne]|nr:hypothetical protein HDU97_009114 [Phlyctochytrium planicorne]
MVDPVEDLGDPDPKCSCRKVMDPAEPAVCASCRGLIRPIFRIQQETFKTLESLVDTRLKLQDSNQKEITTWEEGKKMTKRIEELEVIMDEKAKDMDEIHTELRQIGERVIEEIEKRAELQVSKDALQDELEELTKGLFEEANMLVSTEARRGHHHELRVKNLEQELQEIRLQLQMEQLQLRELKVKMDEEAKAAEERAKNGEDPAKPIASPVMPTKTTLPLRPDGSAGPTLIPLTDDPVDPLLFAEFEDFMSQSATVKLNKLHSIPFMKNTKDDDVNPCLRFGGNPRTYTNKLVEAIMMNSCFVEEMSPAQIASVNHEPTIGGAVGATGNGANSPALGESRGRRPTLGELDVKVEKPVSGASTPTQAIFQRTVLERISTWTLTGGTTTPPLPAATTLPSATGAAGSNPSIATGGALPAGISAGATTPHPGCSACGRTVHLKYHFRISEQPDDAWCPICQPCRDRLIAVCDFYNFVRHVRQGLYSTRRREDLFLEVLALKRKMFYARVGSAGSVGPERAFGRSKPMLRPDSQLLRDLHANDGDALTSPTPVGAVTPPLPARKSMSAQLYRYLNGEPSVTAAATTTSGSVTTQGEDAKTLPSPTITPPTPTNGSGIIGVFPQSRIV